MTNQCLQSAMRLSAAVANAAELTGNTALRDQAIELNSKCQVDTMFESFFAHKPERRGTGK